MILDTEKNDNLTQYLVDFYGFKYKLLDIMNLWITYCPLSTWLFVVGSAGMWWIAGMQETTLAVPEIPKTSKKELSTPESFMRDTLWFHQTWQAGKSLLNGGFDRKITDFYGPFSSQPCLMTPEGKSH